MEIDYKYAVPDQDARARLEVLGKYLENKHGIKVTWTGDTKATFSGKYLMVKIEGELAIGNNRAVFKGEDPGFLLRSRAKDYIQGKLATYLDPKTAIGDLPSS